MPAILFRFFCFFRSRRPAAGGLAMLLLLGALTGCGTKAQNALKVQQTLAEAFRHAQTDPDDTQARQWVDRAIAIAPSDPATYFGSTNPNDPTPNISVAAVFQAVGDDPALADYMTQATQKFPSDYRGFQLLADVQGRLGRAKAQQATAATLAALLQKKLQTPGAQNIQELTVALAQAQIDSGDVTGGAATYAKAMQAYPNETNPPNGLAYAYAVLGTHLPEAQALSQKALALAKKNSSSEEQVAAIQDTLGWTQFRQGNLTGAAQNLQEAASVMPRSPEVRYHLGMVYAAEGKTEAARAELGHAVLLSRNYAAAQQALEQLPKAPSADEEKPPVDVT